MNKKKNDLKSAQDTFKGQISDAINQHEHTGTVDATSESSDFVRAIEGITTLGKDTADATATSNKILDGEIAYVNGEKVIGSMKNLTGKYRHWCNYFDPILTPHPDDPSNQAIVKLPMKNKNSSVGNLGDGLGNTGYYEVGSDTVVAGNLWCRSQDIMSGRWVGRYDGYADEENSIYGTATNDATATSSDIAKGKSAYVKGRHIAGDINTITSGTCSSGSQFFATGWANPTGLDSGYVGISTHQDTLLRSGGSIGVSNRSMMSYIGLTEDKLKYGETIRGIVGKYMGSLSLVTYYYNRFKSYCGVYPQVVYTQASNNQFTCAIGTHTTKSTGSIRLISANLNMAYSKPNSASSEPITYPGFTIYNIDHFVTSKMFMIGIDPITGQLSCMMQMTLTDSCVGVVSIEYDVEGNRYRDNIVLVCACLKAS